MLLQKLAYVIIVLHGGCGVVAALSASAMGKNSAVAALKVRAWAWGLQLAAPMDHGKTSTTNVSPSKQCRCHVLHQPRCGAGS